jgi:membrane protein
MAGEVGGGAGCCQVTERAQVILMDKPPSIRNFITEVTQIWVSEKPNQLAAALAYFGMFSFAAVIYLAYLIAGIFINEVAAAEQFYLRIESVLGPETATFIQDSVSAIASANDGGELIISIVSLISLLLAAMGLFLQLKYVLNRIWGVPLIDVRNKLAIIRQRLFAFIMVIALGLLVILVTVVNVAFAWLGSIVEDLFANSGLVSVLNTLALLVVIVLANAFVYKVLPDVKLAWRDVWFGSIVATLLMVLAGLVMGLYFRLGGIGSAFQAAGAFAVVLIAIYVFAQIFLFGAIITRVYSQRFGSKRKSP